MVSSHQVSVDSLEAGWTTRRKTKKVLQRDRNFGLTMLPPCTGVKHPRPGARVPRTTASAWVPLVQYHLKDGAAAGGEQLAGHKQSGHPALAGAVGHPPLGPVVAAQPVAPGGPLFWLLPAPVTMTTSSGSSRGSRALGSRQLRGRSG